MPSDAKHDVDLSPGDAITPTPTDATDAISPDDVPHNHPARPGAPKQVEPPLSTSNLTREHLRKDAYAEHEQLTSMKRLLSKGEMLFDSELCADCALNGQFDTLKWARANKCPWDENTCANAALRGNLVILEWARANGCTWDTHTCAMAAEGGHLEVLQWARANGCPWDNGSCYFAAWKGHVEILRWARARGCRWTRLTRAKAAILGYFESDGSSSEESDDEGEGNLSSQLLQN